MAKPKNNSVIAKRNRANRQRGSKFEKVTADYLDMDVVPYSGSNARFGWGDIRDSIWLGECKNITPADGRVKIQMEWIDDNIAKAGRENRIPFLAWMPAGRALKYIILDEATFIKLGGKYNKRIEIPKKSVKAVNIFIGIDDGWVKSLKMDAGVAQMIFDDTRFYMMRLEYFKTLINEKGLKGSRQGYDIQASTE